MSRTIPMPVRAAARAHEGFARAWASQPSIPMRPSAAARLLAALRRRLHAVLVRWRHRRQLRATHLALMNLDAATLRDIGIVRTEIESLAAEAHGAVEVTRARLPSRADVIGH